MLESSLYKVKKTTSAKTPTPVKSSGSAYEPETKLQKNSDARMYTSRNLERIQANSNFLLMVVNPIANTITNPQPTTHCDQGQQFNNTISGQTICIIRRA